MRRRIAAEGDEVGGGAGATTTLAGEPGRVGVAAGERRQHGELAHPRLHQQAGLVVERPAGHGAGKWRVGADDDAPPGGEQRGDQAHALDELAETL